MTGAPYTVLGCLLSPERRDEVLGDLAELAGTRGRWRLWWDLASIAMRTERLRTWTSAAALAGAILVLATHGPAPDTVRRIRATDPAGSFTLEFKGSRLIAASLDGVPVSRERLVQSRDRLVIRGGEPGGDLDIHVRPDGSIAWQGRTPPQPSAR